MHHIGSIQQLMSLLEGQKFVYFFDVLSAILRILSMGSVTLMNMSRGTLYWNFHCWLLFNDLSNWFLLFAYQNDLSRAVLTPLPGRLHDLVFRSFVKGRTDLINVHLMLLLVRCKGIVRVIREFFPELSQSESWGVVSMVNKLGVGFARQVFIIRNLVEGRRVV